MDVVILVKTFSFSFLLFRDATDMEKKLTKDLEFVFVGMMKTVKDRYAVFKPVLYVKHVIILQIQVKFFWRKKISFLNVLPI